MLEFVLSMLFGGGSVKVPMLQFKEEEQGGTFCVVALSDFRPAQNQYSNRAVIAQNVSEQKAVEIAGICNNKQLSIPQAKQIAQDFI